MNPEYKNLTKIPYFRRVVLQNFPFIEEDFDALTDYGLLCKVVEYLNKIIEQQNLVNDNTNELYQAYITLKNYVDNYFNNLDVQEEINNKLDEMAQDGTLDQIIEQYLNSSAIWGFDTVADMKNATNLINGSYARTLGYHSKNDGGSSLYKIRSILNTDIVNECNIISLNNNNLIAELIVNDYLNIKQFGSYGNGINDDTTSIQNAINLYKKVFIPKGTYLISNLIIKNKVEIFGESENTILKSINNNTHENLIETDANANRCIIKDLTIDGNEEINNCFYLNRASGTIDGFFDCKHILDNVVIKNAIQVGLYVTSNVRETRFLNLDVAHNGTRGIYLRGTDNMLSNCSSHSNGEDGFYITGSNNKIVNSKAFMNGLSGTNQTIPAGITLRGVVNTITSCEVQENVFDGIKISGYMNVITGCIIDSNGSTAGNINYNKASGVHLINAIDLPRGADFNGLFNNIISSGHVSGNQKYGILIEDYIKGDYINHPSYNIIDSICEEDYTQITNEQNFVDMISFSDDTIPNITNSVILNGNNYYQNIETNSLTGLTQSYYNTDADKFKIDVLTLSNSGHNLKLQSNTYINSPANTSNAIYTIFSSNPNGETYGSPKALIVKYKARTNNKNVAARCDIRGEYWNSDFTNKTSFTVRENYLYSTLSTEFKDCVNILDMRRFNNATLDKLYMYFAMKLDNTISENVGTLEVEFKDIEYYLVY